MPIPAEYQATLVPYEHQKEALRRLKDAKAFALLMEMRTGKTKTIIDDWGDKVVREVSRQLLIVAPAGVYRVWETELKTHLPPAIMEETKVGTWTSGAGGAKKRAFDQFMLAGGVRVLLMNVEALSVVKAARAACETFLKAAPTMMVVDESTIIKNHDSERTRQVLKLGPLAAHRRILSGLPTPRSPLDIYSQMEFLDPSIIGFKSFYAFRNRYAVMKEINVGGRKVKIPVNYVNTDELAAKIAPHSFRVRLQDCYDMPPVTYSVRQVPLTKEQEKAYSELRDFATTEIAEGAHVSPTIVIAQMMRMHQVLCGHVRDEEGQWHAVPERRTETLLQLLDEYDGKAIIWCSYDADVRKVSAALERRYGNSAWREGDPHTVVARFWGGNVPTREQEEVCFKEEPEFRFQVATPFAGGRGRNWSVADLVVYHSCTNDLDYRGQSEDRPKAVGKTRPIGYVDLIVPGTIEEKILYALRNKINLASVINGDNYKEWLI